MSLIVIIILLTGLWICFALPRILSKIERPMRIPSKIDMALEPVYSPSDKSGNVGPIDGPDFYDYYDDDDEQIVRAERGSAMYMLIHQSLNRRR